MFFPSALKTDVIPIFFPNNPGISFVCLWLLVWLCFLLVGRQVRGAGCFGPAPGVVSEPWLFVG